MNEQIELHDTVQGICMKMAQGNPGALRVCVEVIAKTPKIDPDNSLGGWG